MLKSKLLPISIALILLFLALSLPSSGLSVSGTKFEKEVAPGDHISHVMKSAIRSSENPTDIQVEILGYGQSQAAQRVALNASDDKSSYTARPFLKVSPARFHLDPGKSQEITLEGDIPKDVGSGGKYALVRIHTLPKGNGSISFITAIDVPVLLTITGSDIQDKGEIESLTLGEPVSAEKQIFSLVLKNTGNHHFYPLITTTVKDNEEHIMANASYPSGDPSLPTYSKLFSLALSPKTPLKPGIYSANATVSMNDGSILATKQISFEIKA